MGLSWDRGIYRGGVSMRTVVESPCSPSNGYSLERNLAYARLCCLDVTRMGHWPYASHVFFCQFLDEMNPSEREIGIASGFEWGKLADICAVYQDLGVSKGMRLGIEMAKNNGIRVEWRSLPADLMGQLV